MHSHLRIAYLANYQGDDLLGHRPLITNRALAGSHKIATVSAILARARCQVTVFSLGAVAERSCKFYGSFWGQTNASPPVPVSYQTDWDIPVIGRIWGTAALLCSLFKEMRKRRIDVVIVYNCGLPETIAGGLLASIARVPLVLEYEDDASRGPDGRRSWRQYGHLLGLKILRGSVRGLIAVSPQLLSRFDLVNKYLLPGVVTEDLAEVRRLANPSPAGLRFMFSGSIQESKGVNALCEAWRIARLSDCELHVVGEGPLLPELRAKFSKETSICFHGFVPRSRLLDLFSRAHVLVNPHCMTVDIGAVFPFKLIEYLGTGRPVISTPMAPLEGPLASGLLYSCSDSPVHLAEAMIQIQRDFPHWLPKAEISMREAWRIYGPLPTRDGLLRILENAIGAADRLRQPAKDVAVSTQA
jgi:glycosyltransferase involved in cell wall biosynthesis